MLILEKLILLRVTDPAVVIVICIHENGNENHVLFFEIICLFLGLPEIFEATAAYQGTPLQADRHSRNPPTEIDKHK